LSDSKLLVTKGAPQPFGTSPLDDGINFAIYIKQAAEVKLLLYLHSTKELLAELRLDPEVNKTSNVWHICVHGLPEGVCYEYKIARAGKANVPQEEHFVLDPYAKGVDTTYKWDQSGEKYHPKGLVVVKNTFDWDGDKPPKIHPKDLVIYEMHVRGFTKDSSSGVANPGTFLGVIEKIPYLKDLGINAVKLMPVHEFNEGEYRKYNPEKGLQLCNYWGYSTVQFFSPMNRYASCDEFASAAKEFQAMVKAFHEHGIEVFLDVVFNHTAEGNEKGPIYSFKWLDCKTYYLMDKGHFMDFTGCGNTVNCNHPIVRDLIRSSLRYFVSEMHVDGFRFDLGGIFMRGEKGKVLAHPPLIEELSEDPVLASTKLIAEPWDSGGIYCLGNFYPQKERWSEWNGQYRDSMRRFIKGDKGEKREFAIRICGSDVLFGSRSPTASINFITAHDGLTLHDLVSYNGKHNSANAEDNRDGNPQTLSWNCGIEGDTDDPEVLFLRSKQMRNFHVAQMVSQGIPMLLMGNEYAHTRNGNNNAWCQDNESNWFLWNHLQKDEGLFRFYKEMIYFRHRHDILRLGRFVTEEDIDWHSVEPFNADWEGDTKLIAFTLKHPDQSYFLYVAFNTHHVQISLNLPPPRSGSLWKLLVNTAKEAPGDYVAEGEAPTFSENTFLIESNSAIILKS